MTAKKGSSGRETLKQAVLPSSAARYLRYVLAFGVTLAVGLAPLLGKLNVPGFTALLSLYPVGLAEGLVPFAAFVMAMPAIAVQFFAADSFDRSSLRRLFSTYWILLLVVVALCFLAYWKYVVRVPYADGAGTAAYLVCGEQKSTSPCVGEVLEACIPNKVGLDPKEVANQLCAPQNLKNAELILSSAYLILMLFFGGLIGLLVLAEVNERTKKRVR